MLNHEKLSKDLSDYCENILGYKKGLHRKHSYNSTGFNFILGEFLESPVFPKNTLLVRINDKGVFVSKAIPMKTDDQELICFVNYNNKNEKALKEDENTILDQIKGCVDKILYTLEYEAEAIESARIMSLEAVSKQEEKFIAMLTVSVTDDGPEFSYSMVPIAHKAPPELKAAMLASNPRTEA